MLEKLRQLIHVLNMVPCDCGSRDDHWVVKDTINGTVCEAEIVCDDCGLVVNYWAYGGTELPETYTGRIHKKLAMIWQRIRYAF